LIYFLIIRLTFQIENQHMGYSRLEKRSQQFWFFKAAKFSS